MKKAINSNRINEAEEIINSFGTTKKVKYIKKEPGLLERKENEEKIILTEDSRQILFG